jgi:3'-phosphoadenosine 5'-phosphosulfate sulfotransferase (PAPS reductase)/FAD synthetase
MKDSIKIIVPVSGGKDSQACLKMAVSEVGAAYVSGLFCDTQFEHPMTYAHIKKLSALYEVEIETVSAGSVDEKVLKYGRFPGGGARHCTDELKIRPTKKYLSSLTHPVVVYYGMRTDESHDRRARYKEKTNDDLYAPHEIMHGKYPKYLAARGVMFKMPILDWSTAEVMDYLQGEHNPLYDAGMPRVGCFPCLAAGDRYKEQAFQFDDFGRSQRIRVRNLEEFIGKSIFTSKGGCQRNNPDQEVLFDAGGGGCAICSI